VNAFWRWSVALFWLIQPLPLPTRSSAIAQTAMGKNPANVTSGEQSSFNAEEVRVKRPVRVPASVIRIVSQDPAVQELLKDEPGHELPQAWLSASEVHLGGSREKDLVVMGTGMLRGANVTPYWVFGPVEGGFRLLLATGGHDLKIKNTRSRGYRDLNVLAATAVDFSEVFYQYDGAAYKKANRKVERIAP
jgi:hypothetical protein